jgi:hypothetical protein
VVSCVGLDHTGLRELDAIEQIDGDLIIDGGDITHLDGFNHLRKLRRLEIRNLAGLQSISGFNALESLETLIVTGNGALREISGLKRLFTAQPFIPGAIKITGNSRLEDVSFLRGLERVGSSLHLHSNALTSLAGLEALERVDASLSLSSNRLKSLAALRHLTWVDGMLGVVNNDLESLEGLEQLEHLKTVKWNNQPRTIALNKNARLRDIGALKRAATPDGFMIVRRASVLQRARRAADGEWRGLALVVEGRRGTGGETGAAYPGRPPEDRPILPQGRGDRRRGDLERQGAQAHP